MIEREWTGSFADARNVSLRRRHRRLADVPRRRRGARRGGRRAAARAARAAPGARPSTSTETNYTGELGDGTAVTHTALRVFRNRPEYRFRAACTSRSPTRCRCTCPSGSRRPSIRIEHYGYLGAVRDAKEKSRRNIELLRAAAPRRRDSPFLHFNLGSEYGAVGDAQAALAEFERAWELIARRPAAAHATASCPRSSQPLVQARCASAAATRTASRAATRASRATRASPTSSSSRRSRRSRSATPTARCALSSAASRWATRRAAYTATVGMRHVPAADRARRDPPRARRDRRRGRAARRAASASTRASSALVLPFAAALLADGVAPDEVVARVEARVAQLTPTVRFMLGDRALRGRRARRPPRRSTALLLEASRAAATRASRSPRRCCRSAATRRPPRRPRVLADDEPHAGPPRRTELFALLVAGRAGAGARGARARRRRRDAERRAGAVRGVVRLAGWKRPA